ncbi:MAG: type III-A CRISPR-associated RAMP protein Csm5 [Candidatus Kapaibacteriota bacterium]
MAVSFWLKTITPIHIGSGKEIAPEEYFYHNGKSFRIDLEQCFKFLGEKVGFKTLKDRLQDWSEYIIQNTQMTSETKAREKYQLSIFDFVTNFLKDSSLKKVLESEIINNERFHLYFLESPEKPRTNVIEIAKLPDNSAYIPGSSIKGVIRTALLFISILEQPNFNFNRFIPQGSEKIKPKELDDRLYEEFFYCRFEDQRHFDAKYDLLKFIGVRDCYIVESNASNPFELMKVDLFLRNGKTQPQTPTVELIKENVVFKGEIFVDLKAMKQIAKMLRPDDSIIDERGKKVWIGFGRKFQRLFQIDIQSLLDDGKEEEIEGRIIERIFIALSLFAKAVHNSDLSWLEDFSKSKKPDTSVLINGLKSFYQNRLNPIPNKFKIGWASGFTATTVFLALLNKPDIQNDLKEIYKKYIHRRGKNIPMEQFPISRRMAMDNNLQPLPLGWVEFSLSELIKTQETHPTEPSEEVETNPEETKPQFPIEMKIFKGTTNIPAKVVSNTSKPFKVELLVKGYEDKIYNCSGVDNLASIPPGTLIYTMVTDFDTKKNEIRMLKFIKQIS